MTTKSFGLSVSRETIERLEEYHALLIKWNSKINLVSRSTIKDAWTRHFRDSAQIYQYSPENWSHWVDLGSGGGFPGAVIAILAAELNPSGRVTLVESDQRKSAFLRNVFRETGVAATVIAKRIEQIDPLGADVISARALAELKQLFHLAHVHAAPNCTYLFPKGENWQKEMLVAEESWSFTHSLIKSETDPKAIVLKIRELRHV